MLTAKGYSGLSRRSSKLLVEAVIGVIGVLGLLLANASANNAAEMGAARDSGIYQVIEMTAEVDWLEIIF